MNNIKNFLDRYNLIIDKYQKRGKVEIIDTNDGKYVIKDVFSNEKDLYTYLDNKSFSYFLDFQRIDDYNIFPYIEDSSLPEEEKAIDLVYILSILHNKTTFYREISMDNVKKIYEDTLDKLKYLNSYYHELQDVIEQKVYMSPEEYLLIRNMSLVYSSINFSLEYLDKWYQLKKEQKKERVVLLHNRPCLNHIIVGKEKKLISWDQFRRDIPIYDFLYFYRHDFMNVEMSNLFEIYQSKYLFTEDEYLLFLVLIAIPDKLKWSSNHYNNTEQTYIFIKYILKTRDFILKENEKGQKEDNQELDK